MLLDNLQKEKEILNRDNITLEIEINNVREVIKKLNLEYENGNLLKKEIDEVIKGQRKDNGNKANFYMQNILETLEKKLVDIKQMVLIKEQSKLALEIICRNNKEIIRNLDRIKNVTIVALDTAVIVAKSLYNQKLVLTKIKILEKGTDSLIKETANALKENGEDIYKTARSTKPEELLKNAFTNAYETISNVSKQNKKAFPENETQIIELRKTEDRYE